MRVQLAREALEVLDDAVHATDSDERGAGVHDPDDLAQFRSEKVQARGAGVPNGQDRDVGGESAGLQDEGDFDQDLAGFVLRRADGGVGRFGSAVGYHYFDQEVDADEGC